MSSPLDSEWCLRHANVLDRLAEIKHERLANWQRHVYESYRRRDDSSIDRVNEMFHATGVDVAHSRIAGFMTTYWGLLDTDEEAKAMAKKNSTGQVKASSDSSNAVGVAALEACHESQEIQPYTTDPRFFQEIIKIKADVLHVQHNSVIGADTATGKEV